MLEVRALRTAEEIDGYFRLATITFSPNAPVEQASAGWRDSTLTAPGFNPAILRGVFEGDSLIGGCIAYQRRLRIGSTFVSTACIGGVCTHAGHRRRGVARAFLTDVARFAEARGDALLLLDGIPDFYSRFGYADVLDLPDHAISREAALALPPSPCATRPATEDDAESMLYLYERHFGRRTGGFERDLATARHYLRLAPPSHGPTLAVDGRGRVRGYLQFTWDRYGAKAGEVAADDWPAALALLQHHARMVGNLAVDKEAPSHLSWQVPMDVPLYFDLCEHLPVRTEINSRPNAGWQARPTSDRALLTAVAPLLAERASSLASRREIVVSVVPASGEKPLPIQVTPEAAQIRSDATDEPEAILSSGALVQLLFGYRTVEWVRRQPGEVVGDEAAEILEALFPHQSAFIAGSDAF